MYPYLILPTDFIPETKCMVFFFGLFFPLQSLKGRRMGFHVLPNIWAEFPKKSVVSMYICTSVPNTVLSVPYKRALIAPLVSLDVQIWVTDYTKSTRSTKRIIIPKSTLSKVSHHLSTRAPMPCDSSCCPPMLQRTAYLLSEGGDVHKVHLAQWKI